MSTSNNGKMDSTILVRQNENEEGNWWIEARKTLFTREICKQPPWNESKALEIGPGTGSNLGVFKQNGFSDIHISDIDVNPLDYCIRKGFDSATIADASRLPFRDNIFNSVLAGDVLEHVPNDKNAASEIYRVLSPGSEAIFTVPAFMVLWSKHDELAGHKRRYKKKEFLVLLENAGFYVQDIYYFNWILFFPTLFVKTVLKVFTPNQYSDATSVPKYLNRVLTKLLNIDIWLAGRINIPFGVSVYAKVLKP